MVVVDATLRFGGAEIRNLILENAKANGIKVVLVQNARQKFDLYIFNEKTQKFDNKPIELDSTTAEYILHRNDADLAKSKIGMDIAEVLRHRSVETTSIYAKVDVGLLETVAQPWPEVMPC